MTAGVPATRIGPERGRRSGGAGRLLAAAVVALAAATANAPARAASLPNAVAVQARDAPPAVRAFYEARDGAPLWVDDGFHFFAGPRLRPEAEVLLADLREAAAEPGPTGGEDPDRVARLIETARSRRPDDLARAEVGLTEALAAYAADQTAPAFGGGEVTYVDGALRPRPLEPATALAEAAGPGGVGGLLRRLHELNPLYDQLRRAYVADLRRGADPAARRRLALNLLRARALPADPGARYVLVNVAARRLDMVEGGRVVDHMRVVVGKPDDQTPSLAAFIRTAVVRPYWNIPPDLAAERVAPRVLKEGVRYLAAKRYEALSSWDEDARVVDPRLINWRKVASGRIDIHLRQLPGPDNMMGRVKFMFPNPFGVYLHDSPLRSLFEGAERTASAGCVRLEDAGRLAHWLLGERAAALSQPGPPEEALRLEPPTPVYILYLTDAPTPSGEIASYPDVYRRDAPLLASLRLPGGELPLRDGRGDLADARQGR